MINYEQPLKFPARLSFMILSPTIYSTHLTIMRFKAIILLGKKSYQRKVIIRLLI